MLKDLEGQTLFVMSSPERCFLPLADALHAQGIHVDLCVVPDSYEVFRSIRSEGKLGMDRLDLNESGLPPVGLEIDLPIEDFSAELQTVMLLKEPAARELLLLAQHMKDSIPLNSDIRL